MTTEAIEQTVISVIHDLQLLLGHQQSKVTRETRPHKDLPWFDSHLALLASVEIGKRLGCALPDENIFTTKDGRTLLRVSEVVKRINEVTAIRS